MGSDSEHYAQVPSVTQERMVSACQGLCDCGNYLHIESGIVDGRIICPGPSRKSATPIDGIASVTAIRSRYLQRALSIGMDITDLGLECRRICECGILFLNKHDVRRDTAVKFRTSREQD